MLDEMVKNSSNRLRIISLAPGSAPRHTELSIARVASVSANPLPVFPACALAYAHVTGTLCEIVAHIAGAIDAAIELALEPCIALVTLAADCES